ncbi:hypothetical protein HDU82_002296 [Entophlyctis luteolus]|nr:hypothetical protein HDU82_002296 [Entophlyctis luteolus]
MSGGDARRVKSGSVTAEMDTHELSENTILQPAATDPLERLIIPPVFVEFWITDRADAKASKDSVTAAPRTMKDRGGSAKDPAFTSHLRLERALGLGIGSAASPISIQCRSNTTASDGKEGSDDLLVAFIAGAAVVIWGSRKNKQQQLLVASKPKNLSCLSFARSNKYLLAVGESGHNPRILIWNIKTATIVSELHGHKFGVLSCAFSPNSKFLVSVGYHHDGFIYVWNVQSGLKVGCAKISTKLNSVSFDSSNFIITSGFRHFKYWNFDSSAARTTSPQFSSIAQQQQIQQQQQIPVLDGSFASVMEHKNSNFMGIAFHQMESKEYNTYSITDTGILVVFNEQKVMSKWLDLKVRGGCSIAVCSQFIVCGCTDGVIRLFEPTAIKHIANIQKPHYLGIDVAHSIGSSYKSETPVNASYPDVISVRVDELGEYIVAVYSDRSLYIWDVRDVKHIKKYRSFLNHNDCVWGVEMYPNLLETDSFPGTPFFSAPADSPALPPQGLPPNTFVSYSSDMTIRFWNMEVPVHDDKDHNVGRYLRRNIYSKEIIKIMYSNSNEFINSQKNADATASRDRLIHIFNVNESFDLVQTLDDHTSSVTGIKFSENGRKLMSSAADKSIIFRSVRETINNQLEYTTYHNTTGRSTIFDIDVDPVNEKNLAAVTQDRRVNVFSTSTGKLLRSFTPSEDLAPANSSVDSSSSGVTPVSSSGILKVSYDPSGRYVVTAGADRCIRIFDVTTGAVVAKGVGHAEVVTGVKFTLDCRRVVSTSADGCVFVWKLSQHLVSAMRERLRKMGLFSDATAVPSGDELDGSLLANVSLLPGSTASSGFRQLLGIVKESPRSDDDEVKSTAGKSEFLATFEDEQDLPAWARQKGEKFVGLDFSDKAALPNKGLWATRVNPTGIQLYSDAPDNRSPVAKPESLVERRYSIESSGISLPIFESNSGLASTDIVLQDFKPTKDDGSDSHESGSDKDKEEEELPVFADSSAEGAGTNEQSPDSEFAVARHDPGAPIDPVGNAEDESKEGELSGESETDDESSENPLKDPTGRKLTFEEYLTLPLEIPTVRKSVSAKHIMSRDSSRQSRIAIRIETESNSTQGEAAVSIQSSPGSKDAKPSLHVETIGPSNSASPKTDSSSLMVEKKDFEDISSPIRSPSMFSPNKINAVLATAINREAIIESATVQGNPDIVFEPVQEEDTIDYVQARADLQTLRNAITSSASLLEQLDGTVDRSDKQQQLSGELRETLEFVQKTAAEALKATDERDDPAIVELLEKYSIKLVDMVKQKLGIPENGSSATGRLITAKDHASVQINIGDVDANGRFTGTSKAYALSGFVRSLGEADDSINRLATKDGYLKK